MYLLKIIFLLNISFLNYLHADKYSCILATKKYENLLELPENLLLSVSLTESGKKLKNGEFVSWPWTINIKGKGIYFNSKQDAIDYVLNYTSKGKSNLDIGCMQINYMYHPNAFNNFEEAFDPEANVKWSASLLKKLFHRFGSWKAAVGYYHSYRTNKRINYSNKVFNTWVSIKKNPFYDNLYGDSLLSEAAFKKPPVVKNVKEQQLSKKVALVMDKKIDHRENNKKNKRENKNTQQNPYIMARMEKVKFFRNYFSQTREN